MKTILALLFLAFSFLSFAGDDIPAPKGVVGDPETIEDAARVDLPSRTEISLNGLWRSRPIVDGEPADVVPAGDWGWAKIPAFLTRDGVGSALEDQETFYAPRAAVALYDPKGLTKANLERLGVPFRAVAAPEELAKTPGVVVVGREALTRELWEHALLPLVENRRAVVVFEQTQETLESLGFRVQNRGLRQGYVRYRDDARFPGLSDDALANWAGESTLASPLICTGLRDRLGRQTQNWAGYAMTRVWRVNNRGCVATVVPEKPQVGDRRPLVDGLFALEYSPLLEFRTGGGSLILCQLDVTARTTPDPYADALVRELLANAARFAPNGGVPDFLGREAFRAGFAWGVKCWERGKDLVVSSGAKMPKDIHQQIADGARVLALGLTAREIAAWSPVPLRVVETNGCAFTRIEQPDAEILNGLSNADFAWHGRMSFAAFADADPAGNAALKVVRHGKGVIVFWQLPPWKFDVDENPYQRITRRAASRMLARLMCNLGWTTFTNGTGYHKFPMYKDAPEASDDPYDWVNL
jgi:beta-galactosidase